MSDFDAMRADLVDRGLLDGEFRLTAEGNAHAVELIEQLRRTEDSGAWHGKFVIWNLTRNSQVRGIARRHG